MRIIHVIAEEVRALDTSRRALRSFGVVVGGVFVLIGAFVLWRRGWDLTALPGTLLGLGGGLLLLGLIAPTLLRLIYRAWMALALVLGFVMTRVLLTLVFALAVTPIGWLRRTFSDSPIRTRPTPDTDSYWIPREPYDSDEKERLERMY